MSSALQLPRKPEARTEKVEDLVDKTLRGFVRVPRFQRGLKWKREDVKDLFDSIYRGYPIGSLLFYKRPAEAADLEVGPLKIAAPETGEAWWVVDGQQRVTTLAVCLGRSLPLPGKPMPDDHFVLYFNAEQQRFENPSKKGKQPKLWVPLPALLDATRLAEWVFNWRHAENESLRRAVFEAGTRIREYPVPLYLIETEDRQVSEEIFYRTNKTGRKLEWEDVHNALFGHRGLSPSTLEDLSRDLAAVGMGRLKERRLLTCLLALRGKDPTRTLGEHLRQDREALQGAVLEALPVLRRVLSFLRRDAGIPHVRLLPKSILLDVLTRFFARHPEPCPRTRMLLARWFWRMVAGAGVQDDRTSRRRGISAVQGGEEESVQKLLGLVRNERPRPFELPDSTDARADEGRILLLTLAHLGPRDLRSGEKLDIAGLIEKEDRNAFAKILKTSDLASARHPANLALHPGGSPLGRRLLERISKVGAEDPVVRSHAMSVDAAESLRKGETAAFLAFRSETLSEEVCRFTDRMAAWEQNDRPSIEYLLTEAGADP